MKESTRLFTQRYVLCIVCPDNQNRSIKKYIFLLHAVIDKAAHRTCNFACSAWRKGITAKSHVKSQKHIKKNIVRQLTCFKQDFRLVLNKHAIWRRNVPSITGRRGHFNFVWSYLGSWSWFSWAGLTSWVQLPSRRWPRALDGAAAGLEKTTADEGMTRHGSRRLSSSPLHVNA